MRKIVILGTALAVLATVSSCSNEDELVQAAKPAVKGTPFMVNVVNEDGTTRATLIDGETLESFKLYGKNTSLDSDAQMWVDGNVFKLIGSAWTSYDANGSDPTSLTWPVDGDNNALTTPTQFWAVSDNSNAGVTDGTTASTSSITENNIATSQSFVYNFYKDSEAHTLNGGTSFTSVTANNVVDLDKQSDLLVALTSQKESEGSTVSLHFQHALSSLALQVRFSYNDSEGYTANEGAYVKIFWIRIHGLKGGGTFTYNNTYDASTKRWGTSPWTTTGGTDVVYEKVFGDNYDDLNQIDAQDAEGTVTKTKIIDHTAIMVVPQSFTPWPCNGENVEPSNCYVELCMQGDKGSGKLRKSLYYLPLTIASTNNEFLPGVQHTITLNLNYITSNLGAYIFSPAEASGAPSAIFE